MASSIQLLRSTNPQERPFSGNLLEGQPAINIHSSEPGLFFKATDGSLVKVGPAAITTNGLPPNASATGATGNSVGEMWLDKSLDPPVLKVYDGSTWVNAGSGNGNGNVSLLRWTKTATGGETSFSGPDDSGQQLVYTPGLEQVYKNGALLIRGSDYQGDNGTAFTNLLPMATGDKLEALIYSPLNIANLDSSSVTFTQSGNNPQTRSVQEKLRDTVALRDFKSGNGNITQELTNASSEAGYRPVFLDSQGSYQLSQDISARVEDFGSSDISGKYRIIDPYSTYASLYGSESFSAVAPQPTYAANCPKASDISLRVFYARNPVAFSKVLRGDGSETSVTVPVDPTVSKTAITDFHATRIDWFYASATNTADPNYGGVDLGPGTPPPPGSTKNYSTLGKAFIDDVTTNYSIPIIGAINTRTRSDTADFSSFESNGRFFGDPFNPGFISQNVSWAEGAISAGCSAVIIDEVGVGLNRNHIKYLDELRNNMITQQSLAPTSANCGWAKSMAPSIVAFECGSFEALNTTYDWHSLEIQAQLAGSRYVHSSEFLYEITNLDGGLEGFKKRFAMAYANGQIMQVPHDLYVFNSSYRLYATVNEFANYTAFVSASASDLNGYEGVCISGLYREKEYRWWQNPIRITSNPSNLPLAVVARAKVGNPKTVIHIINEGYTGSPLSGPIEVQVKKTALSGNSYSVSAFKPGPPGTTFGRTIVTSSASLTSSELVITINEPPNPWIILTVTALP